MADVSPAFARTYHDYLQQIRRIDLSQAGFALGGTPQAGSLAIPLFGRRYRISPDGILDDAGRQPGLEICVVLCRYLLMCPPTPPPSNEWVTFRDFRDSGPLTVFFANDVERAIAAGFTGRGNALAEAGRRLGGRSPEIDAGYEVAQEIMALPRVPLVLLFNDADDEFPAKCTVLFERRAEQYLDAECLAILGRLFAIHLEKDGRRAPAPGNQDFRP